MGRIAFVFAGQGAQAPGMGADFYNSYVSSKAVFDTADGIRPGTSRQCFEGTEEELQETKNTQPCLYTAELAMAAAVADCGIKAEAAAGFSLGELSALTYAGAVSLEDGIKMVTKRAEFMQEAALESDTSMAAVIKLTNEQIEKICNEFKNIYPVNYNCPGQVSVSGASSEMEAFAEAVKAAGGRAKMLKVNGAFHSPYMSGAAEKFRFYLDEVNFTAPKISVYSNFTGDIYTDDICDTLASQINNPVKWEIIIRKMIDDGFNTFVEIGPGKTLTGLIKRISGDVRLFNVSAPEQLEALKAEI